MDDGIRLCLDDECEGEALIFAHGLNSNRLNNMDFYDEFRDEYRVITYDQRGHGDSDKSTVHMNIKRLGRDLNCIIESLGLNDVTVIGHSMGAATIYSYVDQFGCKNLKRIVASDMSPYMRNDGWKGGIAQGKWSDEDFMRDFDRMFDDVGKAAFHITKNIMDPALKDLPPEKQDELAKLYAESINPFTMASLWYSLFRQDQRPAMSKITVPFLYLMPDNPLYSIEAVNYIKENVQDTFILEDNFPNTTHAIWRQMPHEVARAVKEFIKKH